MRAILKIPAPFTHHSRKELKCLMLLIEQQYTLSSPLPTTSRNDREDLMTWWGIKRERPTLRRQGLLCYKGFGAVAPVFPYHIWPCRLPGWAFDMPKLLLTGIANIYYKPDKLPTISSCFPFKFWKTGENKPCRQLHITEAESTRSCFLVQQTKKKNRLDRRRLKWVNCLILYCFAPRISFRHEKSLQNCFRRFAAFPRILSFWSLSTWLENLVFLSHVPCRSTNPKEKNHFLPNLPHIITDASFPLIKSTLFFTHFYYTKHIFIISL